MSRINFGGFESGDLIDVATSSGTVSVQSTIKRTGTYALRVNPTTTNTGSVSYRGFNVSNGAGGTVFSAASCYLRFWLYLVTIPLVGHEGLAVIRNSATDSKAALRIRSDRRLAVTDRAGTTTIGTRRLPLEQWVCIEMYCNTSTTVGEITVRVNLEADITVTGANTDASNAASIVLGKSSNLNGNSVDFYYDDWAIDDAAFPGSGAVVAALPSANGDTMQWTAGTGASNYTQINEVPPSTSQYVQATAQNDIALFQVPDTATLGITTTVTAVLVLAYGVEVASGTSSYLMQIKSGGVTAESGSRNMATSYLLQGWIRATDPATSAAWTLAGIDGMQIGTKEEGTQMTRTAWLAAMIDYTTAAPTAISTDDLSLLPTVRRRARR